MDKIKLQAILFDLDGTLLDTAPDLATALNQVLNYHGKRSCSLDEIRPHVARGSLGIIRKGFNIDESHEDYAQLKQELFCAYQQVLTDQTTLFHGMEQVLSTLENNNITWGIVTNKPGWLAHQILEKLNLLNRSQCLVAAETLVQRKPHPEPLRYACQLVGSTPHATAYIGDTLTDIQAADDAGMVSIAACYGYGIENYQHWGVRYWIQEPKDIIELIDF